eukprot:gene8167-4226_t
MAGGNATLGCSKGVQAEPNDLPYRCEVRESASGELDCLRPPPPHYSWLNTIDTATWIFTGVGSGGFIGWYARKYHNRWRLGHWDAQYSKRDKYVDLFSNIGILTDVGLWSQTGDASVA